MADVHRIPLCELLGAGRALTRRGCWDCDQRAFYHIVSPLPRRHPTSRQRQHGGVRSVTGDVYVFGSESQHRRLAARARAGQRVLHISTAQPRCPYQAATVEAIVAAFENRRADDRRVLGLLNCGRGTVINEITNIAHAFQEIGRQHPEIPAVRFVGPSREAAQIFSNKRLTHCLFAREHIPCPKAIAIDAQRVRTRQEDINSVPYPAVVKVSELSSGRGLRFVATAEAVIAACDALAHLGWNDLLLCEYIEGIEVSFAVLRLGDAYMRFPACYKERTSTDLRHPDSKAKLAGGLREFESAYCCIENLMKKYDITGLLQLEAIWTQAGGLAFISGATGLSADSVIEFGSLAGFDFYDQLCNWLDCGELDMAFESRLCLQNSVFLHGEPPDLERLAGTDWVLEAKTERWGEVPFAPDQRVRVRVSFVADSSEQGKIRARELATLLGDELFASEVDNALHDIAERRDLSYSARKLAEGVWDDNLSWEFWLSSYLPPAQWCSAVFCVGLVDHGHVVLTRTRRGWEMLGGHIERGESLKAALRREALEEGGFVITRLRLFGFRRVLARHRTAHARRDYPFPLSYIPHFVATTAHPLARPTGEEVLESRRVSIADLARYGVRDYELVLAGVRAGQGL
jgi:8-oxo-dGTP pyrophosphatase MutT (NUDIX family)